MEGYLSALVRWSKLKFRIHTKLDSQIVYFQEREIWWASLGLNIGSEQNGKHSNFERPVLIIKKFNQYILWSVPLTSRYKAGKYYLKIMSNKKEYCFNISQVRLISSKRLLRKIAILSENEFQMIKQRIRNLL